MAWKQIILEGGFPQWVQVDDDPVEQVKSMVDDGYSKPMNQVLRSKYTGWNKRCRRD